MPLICIETALPAKFAATIREALGREPERPPAYEDLEALPQRFVRLPADAAAVKALHRRARACLTTAPPMSVCVARSRAQSVERRAPGLRATGQRSAFASACRSCWCLFVVSAWLDLAVDTMQREPGAAFPLAGLVGEGFYGALLMLFAALLAMIFRQPHSRSRCRSSCSPASGRSARAHDQRAGAGWRCGVVWRCTARGAGDSAVELLLALALRGGQPGAASARITGCARSRRGAFAVDAPVVRPALLPDMGWWEAPAQELARDARFPSPASEAVLSAQQELFDEALNDLEDERPGVTDLYFVGFAPYAGEDVFRKDMELARDLFDQRFDTDGRSIVLINNPSTVLDSSLWPRSAICARR